MDGYSPAARPSTSKSWRDIIAIHPAAELIPLMSPAELRELGENIKKNGLRQPVVVCWDGKGKEEINDPSKYKFLDGRNRLDAMELVGSPFQLRWVRRGKRDGGWVVQGGDVIAPWSGGSGFSSETTTPTTT
jgi:hypothetical protein